MGAVGIIMVIYFNFMKNSYDQNSILSYILYQKWEKMPSIFSFTYIGIVLIQIIVVTTVIRKLLTLFSNGMGPRVKTIERLINSAIKYLSIIGAIFYCISFLGIDSSTLLASAGILTLIVGLGIQSLVSDVVAGIFIVFEGEFRVGDIVTIGDFRGIVREIGMRSTKIEDLAQNIKIFNNSNISGVVNMTRKFSYSYIDVGIDYNESLERVESILDKELPKVKGKIPEITDGPFYKGVVSLGDSSVVIRILAKCNEIDRAGLARSLNREIKLIFDRNHINIPFPQVVINQPTATTVATPKQKKEAAAFVQEQKEASKDLHVTENQEN
ncbi:MAG: mechanosensitive ion channel family protein [Lachnospiraceae bacterium]|nr:mechanosensitive ion channel family protein [Lachnospiraceae bacterium]